MRGQAVGGRHPLGTQQVDARMTLVEAARGASERFGPAGADLEGFDNAGEFRAGKLGRHGVAIAAKQVLGEDIGAGDDQDAILVEMDKR